MSKLNKWLKDRTFHYRDFDLNELVKLKKEKNLKISLCFRRSMRKNYRQIRRHNEVELMDRYPLLDEIAVVDSGSTDDTCAIAAKFGAVTYAAADYLKRRARPKAKAKISGRLFICSKAI
jgi:glucosyl-3-phosphoglycerate synthase